MISNFASGLIILSNKPFVVGDYVDLNKGECEGTVVDVKFLHTIFVDVDGQEIYCPNKILQAQQLKTIQEIQIVELILMLKLIIVLI